MALFNRNPNETAYTFKKTMYQRLIALPRFNEIIKDDFL